MSIGGAFSVLGGFACARVAQSTNYTLGGILAAITASFGLLASGGQLPLALQLALTIATIGSVLLGTRLGMSRVEE